MNYNINIFALVTLKRFLLWKQKVDFRVTYWQYCRITIQDIGQQLEKSTPRQSLKTHVLNSKAFITVKTFWLTAIFKCTVSRICCFCSSSSCVYVHIVIGNEQCICLLLSGLQKLEILVHVFLHLQTCCRTRLFTSVFHSPWNVVCARLYTMMCLGVHQLQQYAIISFKINLY